MDTPHAGNPYVGPRSFRRGDRLHGRDREARQLLETLIAQRIVLLHSPSGAGKTSLIEAVLKDRLREKKFRVLPTIRLNSEPPADLARLVPKEGPRPNRYLLSAFLCLEESEELKEDRLPPDHLISLATVSSTDSGFVDDLQGWGLKQYLLRRWPSRGRLQAPLLVFDQFEEILTVNPNDRRAKRVFFSSLGEALRDSQVWALFAMREEYLAALAPYVREVPTCLNTTYRLDILTSRAARAAIQQPAKAAGVDFHDDAAQALIRDLSGGQSEAACDASEVEEGCFIEPVQLQVACWQLWERKRPDRSQITLQDVRDFGDIGHALASYYAQTVAEVAGATGVQERTIRDWFADKLMTPQGIRRQVLQGPEQSEGLSNRAVEALVRAHLVRPEMRHGSAWYELAHDRLIDPVRRDNETWRKEHLVPLQVRARSWAVDPESARLLRDKELEEAEEWAKQNAASMNEDDRKYLRACQEHRERSRDQRRFKLVVSGAVGLTLLILVSLGLLVRANQLKTRERQAKEEAQRERADAQNHLVIVRSHRLAGYAQDAMSGDPELAIALTRDGIRKVDTALSYLVDPEKREEGSEDAAQTRRALVLELNHGLQAWRQVRLLDTFTDQAEAVAFSADGRLAAVGGAKEQEDAVALIWRVDLDRGTGYGARVEGPHKITGKDREELKDVKGLTAVAFSRNGKWLATGSPDNRCFLWDGGNYSWRGQLRQSAANDKEIKALAFDPTERILVSGSEEGTVVFWDVEKRAPIGSPYQMPGSVTGVAFDASGRWLVAGCTSGTVAVWDVTALPAALASLIFSLPGSPRPQGVPQAAGAFVFRTLESPDYGPYRLVWPLGPAMKSTASDPPTPGSSVKPVVPSINCLAFNPGWHAGTPGETTVVVTGADDGMVHTWNMAPPQPQLTTNINSVVQGLSGDRQPVRGLAFSTNGRWLAAGRRDNQIRVWERGPGNGGWLRPASLLRLAGHQHIVTSVAFHPEYDLLASSSDDGTIRLWSLQPDPELPVVLGLPAARCIAFSPDLSRFASAPSGLREWRVDAWDVATGKPNSHILANPSGTSPGNLQAAFSPDGSRVLLAGATGAMSVHDTNSGQEVFRLPRLAGLLFPVPQSTGNLLGSLATLRLPALPGVRRVAWSGSGEYLAVETTRQDILLLNANSGSLVGRYTAPGQQTIGFGFRPSDDHLVVTDLSGKCFAWDPATRLPEDLLPILTAQSPSDFVYSRTSDGRRTALFRPDPKNPRGILAIRDMATGEELAARPRDFNFERTAFSPDGSLLALAGSYPPSVRVWDTGMNRMLSLPLAQVSGSNQLYSFVALAIAVSPGNNRVAVAFSGGRVLLWDIPREDGGAATLRSQWDSLSSTVNGLTFSPDGERLLVADSMESAVLLSAADREWKKLLVNTVQPVVDLAFSGDGQRVVTVDEGGTIRVWEHGRKDLKEIAGDKPVIRPTVVHTRKNWIAVDAAARRVATIAFDDSVRVTDVESGEVLLRLLAPADKDSQSPNTYSLALSPDGKWLALGTNRIGRPGVAVYQVDGSREEQTKGRFEHADNVYYVAFSADSRWLASASADKTAKVWEMGRWDSPPIVLRGHTGNLSCVAFDPASPVEYVGTVSEDKTVRVWKFTDWKPEDLGQGKSERRGKQVFSDAPPDMAPGIIQFGQGHRLAVYMHVLLGGVAESRIVTYLFDTESPGPIMDLARRRTSRKITPEENEKYLHNLDPVDPRQQ